MDIEVDREFSLDKETISINYFDEFDLFAVYVIAELDALDEKVYILAYGDDEDGIVLVDHCTSNIVGNILMQFSRYYENNCCEGDDVNIFLFAEDNYNEAYRLAIDMKEPTGMLDFQLE